MRYDAVDRTFYDAIKLKDECIPGRRGCVLEGKVKLSEDLQKKVDALSEPVNKPSEK